MTPLKFHTTAATLQTGMRIAMPHSSRELFIEALYWVKGNTLLVIGLPSGPPYGGAQGLSGEEMAARRTYLTFREGEKVTVHAYSGDDIDDNQDEVDAAIAAHEQALATEQYDASFRE